MTRAHVHVLCVLALLCAVAPGCTRQLRVSWSAGACVNPPYHYCRAGGDDSRVLDISVYQLRTMPDLTRLAWDDLVQDGRDLELLRTQLAGREPEAARSRFTVQRADSEREHRVRRVGSTRYLLFVSNGRHAGNRSMLVTRLPWMRGREAIRIEYYDLKPIDPGHAVMAPELVSMEKP